MGINTKIEWAHHTHNPWVGCSKTSPACDFCYAERWALRSGLVGWGPGAPRRHTTPTTWNEPLKWQHRCAELGITERVFANSLSDWADKEVSDDWRDEHVGLIDATPNLNWMLLTKRTKLFRQYWERRGRVPENVWAGTTVELQRYANQRIYELLRIPARVIFLSMEPLLGPIWLPDEFLARGRSAGVITGGETGSDRPTNPDWFRALRDQCNAAGVPYFHKQNGDWIPAPANQNFREAEAWARDRLGKRFDKDKIQHHSNGMTYVRVGKDEAGRELDGRTWDEIPEAA